MKLRLAKKMARQDFQSDFIKTMLRAATAANIISFAGGLPNPLSFPIKAIEQATREVLACDGNAALQYSNTKGYEPLRSLIAARYAKQGIRVTSDDILITNGSQQALDILGAVLIDDGDVVLTENPAYLSALQSFHLHGAQVHTLDLHQSGIDIAMLKQYTDCTEPKFFYAVPTFQNPTGLTYTTQNRMQAAAVLKHTNTLLIEDNPYGELRFKGADQESFFRLLGEQCILLGTFSKIVSPGMRIGWICCTNERLREKMIDYKQIVDLHTHSFGQMIMTRYLETNDLDAHIAAIRTMYAHQADTMIAAMRRYFPAAVRYTEPEGGMFLWVTLPDGMAAVDLADLALSEGVAIAPGDPFYEKSRRVASFRLNYTNCADADIERGIAILGDIIAKLMKN